ncbi:hypothetical protein ABIE65_004770 [Constrictibacter sp. MBR-5]|jgi:hypothetical protein|uniref:DUF3489 domain-containing protein n=1 Tax=Constrictibacter sp. MBR-5 TaxID=3156467 RepID=UPI003396B7A1
MSNLTDTQRLVLAAAAQRADRSLQPLPASLKGGAALKVVNALVTRGLAEKADDGERISQQGLAAIGIEVEQPEAPSSDDAPKAKPPRTGTKQALLINMLRRDEGATIEEVVAATGWQSHTVRGAIAGALKRKLQLDVTSEKVEGRGRVYRIV